jgi:hypothetical protein
VLPESGTKQVASVPLIARAASVARILPDASRECREASFLYRMPRGEETYNADVASSMPEIAYSTLPPISVMMT